MRPLRQCWNSVTVNVQATGRAREKIFRACRRWQSLGTPSCMMKKLRRAASGYESLRHGVCGCPKKFVPVVCKSWTVQQPQQTDQKNFFRTDYLSAEHLPCDSTAPKNTREVRTGNDGTRSVTTQILSRIQRCGRDVTPVIADNKPLSYGIRRGSGRLFGRWPTDVADNETAFTP